MDTCVVVVEFDTERKVAVYFEHGVAEALSLAVAANLEDAINDENLDVRVVTVCRPFPESWRQVA